MARNTSTVLLFGGAVLLTMWIVSPASSAPQTPPPHATATAPETPAGSDVQPVRLPDPTSPPPEYHGPVRDPFAFEARPRPPRAPAALEAPAPARPELPALVAILTDSTPAGDVHRAALSDAFDRVRIVAAGDEYGVFIVSEIRPGVLALLDTNTGDTYRLPLR